jgi:uncharacterized iron-regulated protein
MSFPRPRLPGRWAGVLAACCLAAWALAGCSALRERPSSNSPAALHAQLRDTRFVLLGEVHDNPEQHRQRAELLRLLLSDGRPTRVVFEQMDRGSDAALAAAARDPEAVADAGRLDRAGWQWPLHRPLVDAALAGGAAVRGGNFDRDLARRLVREGLSAAPADLRTVLDGVPWSAEQDGIVRRAIEEGHCGMLPAHLAGPMSLVQRLRDAALAQAMLRAGEARVVLIAGNGHVRSDVGVPHYLRAAGVAAKDIAAVGYVEEGEGETGPFDLRRTTPRMERADPCASFRAPPAPLTSHRP